MIKNYLKSYGYLIGLIVILSIIISIINYLTNNSLNTIKVIIPIFSLFIASIILGINTKEKAYIEGIKFTIIYLVIITILNLFLKTNFNYKTIIIYLIMLFTSSIGSTLGINLQKKK